MSIWVTEVKGMRDWAEFVLRVDEAIDESKLDSDRVITGTINNHKDIKTQYITPFL